MSTIALTLNEQALAFKNDLAEHLDLFFAEMPELESITAQSTALVEQSTRIIVFQRDPVGNIAVCDPKSYEDAAEQIKALKAVDEQFLEIINPFVEKAYSLHKALTAIRNNYTAPGQREQERLKKEMSLFYQEQERQRREAEQREAEEARKCEQDRLMSEAQRLEAEGNKAQAELVLEEAVNVQAPAITIRSTVPSVSGTSQRSVWTFEVLDKNGLKPEFLKVDEKAVGSLVRSMKGQAASLLTRPGLDTTKVVKVWEDKTTIVK